MSMWQAISSAMMRRKRWTILLILIALLETGAAMVLCMLAARQESALGENNRQHGDSLRGDGRIRAESGQPAYGYRFRRFAVRA